MQIIAIPRPQGRAEARPHRLLTHQPKQSPTARLVFAVFHNQRPPMCFCDLPAEYQPNSVTSGLGCEERNEQIGGIGQTGAFVQYFDFQIASIECPANVHLAMRFRYRIDCVFDQINQCLLDLIRI